MSAYETLAWQLVGVGAVFLLVVGIIGIAVAVLMIVAEWKLFRKAGVPGWGAIIPFYNTYLLYKIVWGSGWWFLTLLIPFGGFVMACVTYYKLAKCFGKGTGFGIATVLIPVVMIPILGFGSAEYRGYRPSGKVGCLIASIITGIVMFILFTVLITVGIFAYNATSNSFDQEYQEYENDLTEGISDGFSSVVEGIEEDEAYSEELQGTGSPENPSDFDYLTLNNGMVSVDVPIVHTDSSYSGSSYIQWSWEGISVASDLSYTDDVSVEEAVNESAENYKEIYNGLEGYSNFKESDVLSQEGLAVKLLQYTYTYSDNTTYDSYIIIKAEDVNGYNLLTDISIDMEYATESAISNTLNAYGVSIN